MLYYNQQPEVVSLRKTDLRKYRTKLLFSQALLQLLAEKPLNNISVKDLIARAELNRSTFYLHYLDMPDFIEATFTQALEGLKTQLLKFYPLESDALYTYYHTYLVWFDEYRLLLQALQSTSYAPLLWQKLDNINSSYLDSLAAHNKMHILYISTADRGLFAEWLLNSQAHSLEALAQLLAQSAAKIIDRN